MNPAKVLTKRGPRHFFDGRTDPGWMARVVWWAISRSDCHFPIRRPMCRTYMWLCLN